MSGRKRSLAEHIQAETAEAEALKERLAADRKHARTTAAARELEQKYKAAVTEIERLEERLRLALELRENVRPIKVKAAPKVKGQSDGCAIALASDWHVGQRIDAATVNYINEFNPEVAELRAARFFNNTLKLVRKERKDIPIPTLLLWIGGDILSGWIHPELQQTNYLTPQEECVFAQNLFLGGIQRLLEDGEFTRILVVCSVGNHGRSTQKNQHANGVATSNEWMVYKNLEAVFSREKTIEFTVATSYATYAEVFGRVLRFSHGENIRFQGGVGGISIPLNKWVARMNQQRAADLDSIGHFHQRIPYAPGSRWQVNGCLCGFDTYALAIGASPEPPMQNFQLLDSRRGFTVAAPILLAED